MNTQSDANIDPAGWRDYLELCKPNVVALMILTSLIGMLLATDQMVPFDVLILGNLGIALSAGAAAAVNHIVDQHVDELMARTSNRPIARGRVTVRQAIFFATATGVSGLFILIIFINPLTAWLTLGSLVGYAFIYTMYLKRATPQNIVIGGLAGAAPPLLGWTAVTGEIHHNALLLVLIIFAWTPPHFWALAVHRKDEYAKADIPMLPVTHGEKYTKIHIFLYTLILLVVSVMPFLTGMLGWLYLVGALSLGIGFIFWSVIMLYSEGGDSGMKAAPPLLGWTAVTGEIHHNALLLVLIIFAWTPPHFWALAVHRKDEYAKADIPMLPVTHGEKYTKIHIFLYTLILLVVSVMPFLTGMLGWLYLVGALSLGIGFIFWSVIMLYSEGGDSGMKTFNYSIVYLISLFCIMLLDHYAITSSNPF